MRSGLPFIAYSATHSHFLRLFPLSTSSPASSSVIASAWSRSLRIDGPLVPLFVVLVLFKVFLAQVAGRFVIGFPNVRCRFVAALKAQRPLRLRRECRHGDDLRL